MPDTKRRGDGETEDDLAGLDGLTAAEAIERIQSAPAADLAVLEQQESAGQGRTTVLGAVAHRRAALQATDLPTYTADDLISIESESGRRALVRAAFTAAGVERLPLDEARKLVSDFASREDN